MDAGPVSCSGDTLARSCWHAGRHGRRGARQSWAPHSGSASPVGIFPLGCALCHHGRPSVLGLQGGDLAPQGLLQRSASAHVLGCPELPGPLWGCVCPPGSGPSYQDRGLPATPLPTPHWPQRLVALGSPEAAEDSLLRADVPAPGPCQPGAPGPVLSLVPHGARGGVPGAQDSGALARSPTDARVPLIHCSDVLLSARSSTSA